MNSNRKLSLLVRKVVPLLISFAILMVGLEIACGVVFWIKDNRAGVIRVPAIDHPYTYFTFDPNPVKFTNDDGLYTKATRTKPPGKFRIMLVGGSVARSSQGRIPYEQTIASELERALNSRLKTNDIEVVNAGMTAYVAEQEFILIQLVLQYYQPDMIITLDGYNDLMSFDANRPYDPPYAPIEYRNLKVINSGKERRSALYRVKVCFKNVVRAKRYFFSAIWKDKQHDYDRISDDQIDSAADAYLNILRDMKDLASSKKIAHYSFLQPISWYAPFDPSHRRTNGVAQLAKLYGRYEMAFGSIPWGHSLTSALEANLDLYFDDVHVQAKGNEIMAAGMADFLQNKLLKHPESARIISLP